MRQKRRCLSTEESDSKKPKTSEESLSTCDGQSKRVLKPKISKKESKSTVWLPRNLSALDRLSFIASLLLTGVDDSWRHILQEKLFMPAGLLLLDKYGCMIERNQLVLPPMSLVFEAFRLSQFQNTKVIILGQDPYHRVGQAMGLAFSVPKTLAKLPPSLKNIYIELGFEDVGHGDLSSWATQGVLLLNPVLTVLEGHPNSHAHLGWQLVTDGVLEALSKEGNKVFMLWGGKAQERLKVITSDNNLCLLSAHPSPLATRGDFKGCGHFTKCNEFLREHGTPEINWSSVLPLKAADCTLDQFAYCPSPTASTVDC